eukprot:TRINITY_DN1892_c0_g1_i2.p1 TRINITY_DN1892_c0_g1~~TRINITY_DN1892_c0_g1_i2.p1  ORF type:complete len:261 (-),score=43.52 TRINITY_DN1892_c0_g1_i2:67-849(-)
MDNKSMVYIIDFGLSKRYVDPKTGKHIPYKNDKSLTGTARYASISTHMGIEQSRRDDLEEIAYMLIYFLLGRLPWQGQVNKDKDDKYQKIMQCKIGTPIDSLCKGLPGEFQTFLRYTRNLKFEEDPDYDYLRGLLRGLAESSQADDGAFDWSAQEVAGDRNRTFMHLRAKQHKIARRYSDAENTPSNEKGGLTCQNKRVSALDLGTPLAANDSFMAKFTPRMRMENIGTTNEMFAKYSSSVKHSKKKKEKTDKGCCCIVL